LPVIGEFEISGIPTYNGPYEPLMEFLESQQSITTLRGNGQSHQLYVTGEQTKAIHEALGGFGYQTEPTVEGGIRHSVTNDIANQHSGFKPYQPVKDAYTGEPHVVFNGEEQQDIVMTSEQLEGIKMAVGKFSTSWIPPRDGVLGGSPTYISAELQEQIKNGEVPDNLTELPYVLISQEHGPAHKVYMTEGQLHGLKEGLGDLAPVKVVGENQMPLMMTEAYNESRPILHSVGEFSPTIGEFTPFYPTDTNRPTGILDATVGEYQAAQSAHTKPAHEKPTCGVGLSEQVMEQLAALRQEMKALAIGQMQDCSETSGASSFGQRTDEERGR
jgi:hypothetical protein